MPPLSEATKLRRARMQGKIARDPNAKPHPRVSVTPSRSRSSTPATFNNSKAKKDKECPVCQSTNIINDEGKTVCNDCGCLLSESQIAADPTFQEGSNGAAQLLGQHVGAGQATARAAPGTNRTLGFHDSHEQTRSTAKSDIRKLGTSMGLQIEQCDRAHHVWILAFNCGATKGREKIHISAVCLYISLRRENSSQHLLIDFAEKVNTNVFFLGHIYQDVVRRTYLATADGGQERMQLHAVNIENLIHRYCAELEFGADAFRIASEAVRIFKRMDRDWITTGRRPAGLCGAAIILAARMNNYRRTAREVVYTVKVCEVTINKRLEEFGFTAAAKLPVGEFQAHARKLTTQNYYKRDADDGDGVNVTAPPAYYRQFLPKKTRKRKRGTNAEPASDDLDTQSIATDEGTAMDTDEPESTEAEEGTTSVSKRSKSNKRAGVQTTTQNHNKDSQDRQAMPPPPPPSMPIDPALLEASNEAYASMNASPAADAAGAENPAASSVNSTAEQDGTPSRAAKPAIAYTADGERDLDELEADIQRATLNPVHDDLARRAHEELEANPPDNPPGSPAPTDEPEDWDEENTPQPDIPNHPDLQPAMVTDADGNSVAKTYWPTTAYLTSTVPDTPIVPEEEFSGDPEVDDCFLNEDERNHKERIWITKYGKYLQDLHLKKLGRLLDEQNGVVKTRAKRTKPRLGDVSGYEKYADGTVAQSLGEAYQKLWQHRGHKGMSSKINWDRVKEIYREKSPTDTSQSGADTPQKIFSSGDLLLKKIRKKQPSTRAGRDEQKRLNAERRAAKKAEKERLQVEKNGAAQRVSEERGRRIEALIKENESNQRSVTAVAATESNTNAVENNDADDADAAADRALADLDHARMQPGGLGDFLDEDIGEEDVEDYDEEPYDREDYDREESPPRSEEDWDGQEV